MKIVIVGGGNMGQTYARSFLRSQIATAQNMMILEKSVQKAKSLKDANIGHVHGNPEECIPFADLIILAVKPQDSQELFKSIQPYIEPQQVILSIMAGVTMDAISNALQTQKVIRAMPNLPAQIGMGMTVFTSTEEVTRIELVMVQNLINTTGKSIYVENESIIDASTAISGSGPAYVFYFMEAMMQGARNLGFSKSEAELLVTQTFFGTVELYIKSKYNCEEWIQMVASKGGTTEAALESFALSQLNELIIEGTERAHQRAVELGELK